MRGLLVNMPDLIRGLTRVQYGKVSCRYRITRVILTMVKLTPQADPAELATILIGLTRVGTEFRSEEGSVFRSSLLNNILSTLPSIAQDAKAFLADYNVKMAREGDIGSLWNDVDKYPDLQDAKDVSTATVIKARGNIRKS
jgi:DNA mismatch repair protein MSH3